MEEWKDIYKGYQVSNLGRVKSLKRKEEKIMKLKKDSLGYVRVHLRVNNSDVMASVHRLVAKAFIPNNDGKEEVNHINGIKTDNRVENLEWSTKTENIVHAYKTKLRGNSKEVYCVELDKKFYSARNAGKELNLKHTHIIDCCRGKQKTTGGYHWKYA